MSLLLASVEAPPTFALVSAPETIFRPTFHASQQQFAAVPAVEQPERTIDYSDAIAPDSVFRPIFPTGQQQYFVTSSQPERTATFYEAIAPPTIDRPTFHASQQQFLAEPRRDRTATFFDAVAPDAIDRPTLHAALQQFLAAPDPAPERTATFFDVVAPDAIDRPTFHASQQQFLAEPRRERTATFFDAVAPDAIDRPTFHASQQQFLAAPDPAPERTATFFDVVAPDAIDRPTFHAALQQFLAAPERVQVAVTFFDAVAPDAIPRPTFLASLQQSFALVAADVVLRPPGIPSAEAFGTVRLVFTPPPQPAGPGGPGVPGGGAWTPAGWRRAWESEFRQQIRRMIQEEVCSQIEQVRDEVRDAVAATPPGPMTGIPDAALPPELNFVNFLSKLAAEPFKRDPFEPANANQRERASEWSRQAIDAAIGIGKAEGTTTAEPSGLPEPMATPMMEVTFTAAQIKAGLWILVGVVALAAAIDLWSSMDAKSKPREGVRYRLSARIGKDRRVIDLDTEQDAMERAKSLSAYAKLHGGAVHVDRIDSSRGKTQRERLASWEFGKK